MQGNTPADRSADSPSMIQVPARKEHGCLRDLEDVLFAAEPERDEDVGQVGMILCGSLRAPVRLLALPDLLAREVRRGGDHGVQEAHGRVLGVVGRVGERAQEAPPVDEVDRFVRVVKERVDEAGQERI